MRPIRLALFVYIVKYIEKQILLTYNAYVQGMNAASPSILKAAAPAQLLCHPPV